MRHLYLYIVTLFTVAASGLPLSAVTVTSQAGTLCDVITDTGISELTLDGTIDATDIDFIASHLTGLRSLDLSSAVITACSGVTLFNGRTSSPANTLPEYSLTGSPLTSIILPSSLTAIADGALAGSSISSLVIPAGVDSLGIAFCNGCAALESVTFATTRLDAIPTGAFKDCTSLTAIELPQGVATIGADAMRGCTGLTRVTLPATLAYIGHDAFSYTALTDIDLSGCHRLGAIGGWAFAGCDRLTSAILPDGVTTLGDGIFFGCDALATVVMPASATTLAPYMFKGTAITDGSSVVGPRTSVIGRYALYGNDRLTVLTLPSALTSIGDMALAGMSGLTRIDATALTALPTLGDDVFAGTSGSDVTLAVAESMADVFKATPQWKEFNVIYDMSSVADTRVDGSLDVGMRYDDNTLYINSSEPLALITVVDLTGRTVARHAADRVTEAAVGINLARGTAVVVSIMLTDGRTATFKTIL
ncbi:MAG: leucine-rich repeat domain-containing protein [Muribaculaceae bacterium]|nr:leucine-rich repeat domain-containing protein [Muribaculaceae bacterium]